MKYYIQSGVLFAFLFVITGCHLNNERVDTVSTHVQTDGFSRTIPRDSLVQPARFKAPHPRVIPARITNQTEVSHGKMAKPAPRRKAAKAPVKKTPGTESYLLPQQTSAVPVISELMPPELLQIKAPVSRDNNPFSFLVHQKTHGLSHNDITYFLQDHKGNLWMGTNGGGIMRFDGQNIAHYYQTPVGEISTVTGILEDAENNIWIATMEGLHKFDGQYAWYYDAVKGGLLSEDIYQMQMDREGNIWLSYYAGGISMFDGTDFYHFGPEQGLPVEESQILHVCSNGDIWISAYGLDLIQYHKGAFYFHQVPGVTYHHSIMGIGSDRDCNIWFSIYDRGVGKFDGKNFAFYEVQDGFPEGTIYKITEDLMGRMWFATWGRGAIVMDQETLLVFTQTQGLPSNLINDIFEDHTGIIWMGTMSGVARYYGNIFTHYNFNQLFDQQTNSMTQTRDGTLWLTSEIGDLASFDGKKFQQYSHTSTPQFNYANGVFADSKDNLWLSINEEGIFRFDGKNFYHYHTDQLPTPLILEGGIEDSRGNIWMKIANHGLIMFDGEYFSHYTTENGLPENNIMTISEDRKGNIWAGTMQHGLFIISENTFTYYDQKNGLNQNYVYVIYEDSEENIWLGTYGNGLFVYNGIRFLSLSRSHGLSDDFIFSITQDVNGNMIIGSRFGLNILYYDNLLTILEHLSGNAKPEMLPASLFRNFTVDDGFLGMGSNLGMIIEDGERIWIGANDRLTAYFPSTSIHDSLIPEVQINQIDLFTENIDWRGLYQNPDTSFVLSNGVKFQNFSFSRLTPWYQIPENLVLAYQNNYLSFRFAGISPSLAGKLLYSYKLEGLEKNWHPPTRETTAHYGNLPPGEYTFKVKALNRMGLWSPEAHFSFVITPPWWKTWWARLTFLLAVVLAIWLIIKARERTMAAKNKLLDQQVALAHQTIQIKQNIIANVSHELRTPLTGIIGLTNILGKTPLNQTQQAYLDTLKQSGESLRSVINQILDYSRLESGKILLETETFSIAQLFSHAQKVFEAIHEENTITLHTRVDPDIPQQLIADRGRVNQVLQNLFYNALKFTHRGSIWLEAQLEKRLPETALPAQKDSFMIKISVKDTGIGIPREALQNLFVPFSRIELKDTREQDSTGLGLAISKNLATLMDGEIGVESTLGEGSHFWFTFKARMVSQKQESESLQTASPKSMRPLRILLVEDKKVNQMVIKLLLESMGHEVVLASHGKHALEVFEENRFDLIFMDIQMPVMNGIEATKALKHQYQNLPPIVGISANAFEGDREKYMGQGMDEYITKPVTEDSIIQVMKKILHTDNNPPDDNT